MPALPLVPPEPPPCRNSPTVVLPPCYLPSGCRLLTVPLRSCYVRGRPKALSFFRSKFLPLPRGTGDLRRGIVPLRFPATCPTGREPLGTTAGGRATLCLTSWAPSPPTSASFLPTATWPCSVGPSRGLTPSSSTSCAANRRGTGSGRRLVGTKGNWGRKRGEVSWMCIGRNSRLRSSSTPTAVTCPSLSLSRGGSRGARGGKPSGPTPMVCS